MKYKVGDRVLIRQWDDMAKEFGLDKDGDINTKRPFCKSMKKYCGTIQRIREIRTWVYMLEDCLSWAFSEETIERKVEEMTKSDLRTGHIVTLRDGRELEVYLGASTCLSTEGVDLLVNNNDSEWEELSTYNDDLTYGNEDAGYSRDESGDIVKVEKTYYPLSLQDVDYMKKERVVLWERKEPKKMTLKEIEGLLGYQIKIVEE